MAGLQADGLQAGALPGFLGFTLAVPLPIDSVQLTLKHLAQVGCPLASFVFSCPSNFEILIVYFKLSCGPF